MNIRLHKNARSTPAIRLEIQRSTESDYALAARLGLSRDTVRKWRKRDTQHYSHTAHQLQTTLNAGQEAIVVELRKTLQLSLDDLLSVVREFIHADMSRSALDRLLRRRGVSRLARRLPIAGGGTQPTPHGGLQSLRAGLSAHRREIPATDAR